MKIVRDYAEVMSSEIEIIVDGDGIALIGDGKEIEKLLSDSRLTSTSIDLPRLTPFAGKLGIAAQGGAEIVANAGRWIKLTEESAKALKLGNAMKGSTGGFARTVLTENGKISKILEFVKPGQLLSNPAFLTGVGGMMAQYAMQQAMEEITDYLKRIEEKLGDVVQALKDAQIAPMLAAADTIDDVLAVRDSVGRVSETSWSKVQAESSTLATAQNYALLQVASIAKKLAKSTQVPDALSITRDSETELTEWLVVIAQSLRLQDAVGIIELERIFDSHPEELDSHRQGLTAARRRRFAKIDGALSEFDAQLVASVEFANKEVVWNPFAAKKLGNAAKTMSDSIVEFQRLMGIESLSHEFGVRPWKEGAENFKDEAIVAVNDVAKDAKQIAEKAGEKAKELAEGTASKVVNQAKKLQERISEKFSSKD